MRRTKRTTFVAALVAALSMLLATVALADDISNNIDADVDAIAEVMALTASGTAGSTVLRVVERNGDGKNGCNLTGSTTLQVSVASSSGAVATVSPASVTFTSCSYTETLTVTPLAEGSTTISLTQVANTTDGSFNLAPATFTVNVAAAPPSDTTAPDISYDLDPTTPDGENGWYKSDVTLTWTVTENESASSLVETGCVNENITADQAAATYSCSATSDGGTAGPVNVSIKRDATDPIAGFGSGGPADGATYYTTQVPAAPTPSCSDASPGSGIAASGGCVITGYSAAAGNHTMTVDAKDDAGNTDSTSISYTVREMTHTGFYAPVDMNNVVNIVKGGSTVPLKFNIKIDGVEQTATGLIAFSATKSTCASGSAEDAIEMVTSGNTSLRYDSTGQQFIQNWKVPTGSGVCYKAIATLADGDTITALFKAK